MGSPNLAGELNTKRKFVLCCESPSFINAMLNDVGGISRFSFEKLKCNPNIRHK